MLSLQPSNKELFLKWKWFFLYCREGGIYTFKYALSHGIKTRLVGGGTTIKNSDKGKEKIWSF